VVLNRRRKTLRLTGFDYHTPGAYFVTICTFERRPVLGIVGDEGVVLSEAGLMGAKAWAAIPNTCHGARLDEFVVMPNHLHGLLLLHTEPVTDGSKAGPVLALPDVIQRFKSWTTTRYRKMCEDYLALKAAHRLWQRSYHERVIRSERKLAAVREYIALNPGRWQHDSEFAR